MIMGDCENLAWPLKQDHDVSEESVAESRLNNVLCELTNRGCQ